MSWATEVAADSPTWWMRLEETAGQHQDETAGNRDSTTVTVTGQGTVAAPSGWAGVGAGDDFNGTTDYVEIPDAAAFFPGGAGAYTLELVARIDTMDATFRRLLSHEEAGTINGYNIAVSSAGLRTERWGGGVAATIITWGSAVVATVYHIVVTFDGTNYQMYANGALVGGPTAAPQTMTDPATPLTLGKRSSDATRFFDGQIWEAAVYIGSALSSTRISAHYAARDDTGAPPISDASETVRVVSSGLRLG